MSAVIDFVLYLSQGTVVFRNSNNNKGKLINLFWLLVKQDTNARIYSENLEKHHTEGTRLLVNFFAYNSSMNLASTMKDREFAKESTKQDIFPF